MTVVESFIDADVFTVDLLSICMRSSKACL
jgi:hypothetical protein